MYIGTDPMYRHKPGPDIDALLQDPPQGTIFGRLSVLVELSFDGRSVESTLRVIKVRDDVFLEAPVLLFLHSLP